jgi:hypothetical protein
MSVLESILVTAILATMILAGVGVIFVSYSKLIDNASNSRSVKFWVYLAAGVLFDRLSRFRIKEETRA